MKAHVYQISLIHPDCSLFKIRDETVISSKQTPSLFGLEFCQRTPLPILYNCLNSLDLVSLGILRYTKSSSPNCRLHRKANYEQAKVRMILTCQLLVNVSQKHLRLNISRLLLLLHLNRCPQLLKQHSCLYDKFGARFYPYTVWFCALL